MAAATRNSTTAPLCTDSDRSISPAIKCLAGSFGDPLSDRQRRAAKRLRHVDLKIVSRTGLDGLAIVRAVLSDWKSVEAAARERGAGNEREVRSWGWLFRRALDVAAITLGFANVSYREHQRRMAAPPSPPDPAADPARKASAAELSNPALREGRRVEHTYSKTRRIRTARSSCLLADE